MTSQKQMPGGPASGQMSFPSQIDILLHQYRSVKSGPVHFPCCYIRGALEMLYQARVEYIDRAHPLNLIGKLYQLTRDQQKYQKKSQIYCIDTNLVINLSNRPI